MYHIISRTYSFFEIQTHSTGNWIYSENVYWFFLVACGLLTFCFNSESWSHFPSSLVCDTSHMWSCFLHSQVQQLEAQVQQLMAAKTSRPSGVESVEHNHPASSSVTHSRPAAVTQSSNGESSLSLPVQESGANDASPQDTSDPLPRDSEDPDITQTSTDELSETAAPETPSSATVVNVGPSHS